MKKLLLLFLVLLVPVFASAATLHGTVYDLDFEVVENVVVEINSNPMQSMIAADGDYSFELNEGEYVLEAKYYIGQTLISSVSEEVSIIEEGDYVLDLILFPNLDDEVIDDFDFDEEETRTSLTYWMIGLAAFFILFVLFKKKPKKKVLDKDEADDVLEFIKKEGGRTTQKEIRKNLGLGEAKMSLIIAELEHKKVVKRIKKGRGNIIILNK
jgi:uncharacterized membrane protein